MKDLRISLLLILTLISVTSASNDPVTVTAALPSSTPDPSYTSPSSFQNAVLNTTNQYRAEHSAPDLIWNKTLASFSHNHAKKCEFEHSGGPYGENLAIGYPNASSAVAAWGDERDDYNYGKGKFSKKTGHFTQLVWNETEEVGCGRRECGDKGWIVVCEYWPRGNVEGEFEDMVGKEEDGAEMIGRSWGLGGLVVGFGMVVVYF